MDEVLHEGKQVAVGDDLQNEEEPPASQEIQQSEHKRGRDQHQQSAAAKRINKRAGEPGEKAFRPRRALNLHLHRHAFGAASAAEFLKPARGDAYLTEEELAMRAEEPARCPRVVFTRAGTDSGGRCGCERRCSNRRLDTSRHGDRRRSEGDGGGGPDADGPGWTYSSRGRWRPRGRRGWRGARAGRRISMEHHLQAPQVNGLPGLEHCLPHTSAIDECAVG